jgi:hypothetical protein
VIEVLEHSDRLGADRSVRSVLVLVGFAGFALDVDKIQLLRQSVPMY